MKTRTLLFGTTAVTALVLVAASLTPANAGGSRGVNGPDVTASRVGLAQTGNGNDIQYSGTVGGVRSYSFASTSCNAAYPGYPAPDVPADWNDGANPPGNPIIVQQLYRLNSNNTRFEQLGLSWGKRSFCAVSEPTCSASCAGTSCDTLGIGCADTYWAGLNAGPGGVGPRWEVNPQGQGRGQHHDDIYSNPGSQYNAGIHVKDSDVVAGSRYFGEIQYICHDEALARRGNNASYREMFFSGNTLTGAAGGQASVFWGQPAINAWKAANPAVTIVTFNDDPGAGIFHLAYLVTDNGDGTWTYEYALHNLTSQRAARGFSIPCPAGVTVNAMQFHDVDYHTNDGWNGAANFEAADWPATVGSGTVSWLTADFATNPNANALRYGTLYNYRFTTNTAPVNGDATITMYRTGGQPTVAVPVLVPDDIVAPVCPADLTDSVGGDPDGTVDIFDLLALLGNWGTAGSGAKLAPDEGVVDIFDLLVLLGAWGNCNP